MSGHSDPHHIEGVNRRERRGAGPWPWIAVLLLLLLVAALVVRPDFFGEDLPEPGDVPEHEGAGVALPEPPPTPPAQPEEPIIGPADPDPPLPRVTPIRGETDIQALSKDIDLQVTFEPREGGLASAERSDRASYAAEYTLRVDVPKSARTVAELSEADPQLPAILPGLEAMAADARVSPWYQVLYQNKVDRLRRNVRRLDQLLTRHNFYDCQAMLNLRHPESKQRLFLLQAEMDVVSDGSDGDRLAEMPEEIVTSTHYQPFTSYSWPKQTEVPNPMLAGWVQRVANADRELADPATTDARKAWLRERRQYLLRGIEDMKRRSWLVADYDPFIVIPIHMIRDRDDPYAPNRGDYAVVIHGGRVFPAIVGDAGPSFKVGEASLRMAREIDPSASPYRRPVSDLTVTYLVFPRSADEPWRQPDYDFWRKRCAELLEKVGGLGEGYELHQWEDLFPKPEADEDEAGEEDAEEAAGEE